jgi:hypothetical protein
MAAAAAAAATAAADATETARASRATAFGVRASATDPMTTAAVQVWGVIMAETARSIDLVWAVAVTRGTALVPAVMRTVGVVATHTMILGAVATRGATPPVTAMTEAGTALLPAATMIGATAEPGMALLLPAGTMTEVTAETGAGTAAAAAAAADGAAAPVLGAGGLSEEVLTTVGAMDPMLALLREATMTEVMGPRRAMENIAAVIDATFSSACGDQARRRNLLAEHFGRGQPQWGGGRVKSGLRVGVLGSVERRAACGCGGCTS